MMQHKRQYLGHLPVAARPLEDQPLQLPERLRQLGEGRPVTQGTGLALDYCQIVAPVIHRLAGHMVRALNNPNMLAHDLPFGNNNDPVRVYPQAYPLVRKRCRHAITVTVKVHEAGRGYPLAVFDKAVEDTALRHQAGDFLGMHISHGTRQATVLDMPPLRNAMFL